MSRNALIVVLRLFRRPEWSTLLPTSAGTAPTAFLYLVTFLLLCLESSRQHAEDLNAGALVDRVDHELLHELPLTRKGRGFFFILQICCYTSACLGRIFELVYGLLVPSGRSPAWLGSHLRPAPSPYAPYEGEAYPAARPSELSELHLPSAGCTFCTLRPDVPPSAIDRCCKFTTDECFVPEVHVEFLSLYGKGSLNDGIGQGPPDGLSRGDAVHGETASF